MQYCTSEIYIKLKPHFTRALDLKFYSEDIQNSGLIRSILIAYYWNYEGIKGRIFQKMLKESSIEILIKILDFACTDFYEFQKHEILDSTRIKILILWKELKTKFESVTEEGIEKARFDLFELIRYWNKINQELFELLEYSINNFKTGINVGDLIEELDRLFEINGENVIHISQLILMLTEKKYVPFSEGEYGGEIYDLLEKFVSIESNSIIQNIKDACINLIKNSDGLQKRGRVILKKLGG